MRIISLVPSWTETLLEAGLNVVGRTRFCLYPAALVKSIAVVGGTKDADVEKIKSLRPDVILLDKEENPKWMSEISGPTILVTQIHSLADLTKALLMFSQTFSLGKEQFLEMKSLSSALEEHRFEAADWWNSSHWVLKKKGEWNSSEPTKYLIWKNPWMGVSQETYIGDLCHRLGIGLASKSEEGSLYPTYSEEFVSSFRGQLLFSTEPFPFEHKWDSYSSLAQTRALVNGESFSWFGIRSLRALNQLARVKGHSL